MDETIFHTLYSISGWICFSGSIVLTYYIGQYHRSLVDNANISQPRKPGLDIEKEEEKFWALFQSEELDEITKRPADASVEMYEAYLQVNVVEGEVTNKNYHKIKCKYLNEELDNFLDNIVNPQDDWNVKNDKNFFSVKEQVQQANQEIANEASKRKTKKKKGKQKASNVETKPNVTKKNKKNLKKFP